MHGNYIVSDNTCSIIKQLITKIFNDGILTERKVGNWCLKKQNSSNILELHGILLHLTNPKNCMTSQHNINVEIETEDYLCMSNPGFIEHSDWKFYKKFKVNEKYPYTYGESHLDRQ
jgi:hypothetical protein